MKLIAERLERILEMKLVEKRSDTVEGKFIVTETLKNEFTPKALRLKSQNNTKTIQNTEDKILQEMSCDTEFKLNKAGDIVWSKFTSDHGVSEFETNNYYDSKKRLVSSIAKSGKVYDGIMVPCTIREGFIYDEQGRISIYISDTLHEETHKDKNEYLYFVFNYDEDCNTLSSINILRTIPEVHEHQTERHVVNYKNGLIDSIHNIDHEDEVSDEYFQYFEDNTVVVVRCTVDENKTVIGKVTGTFKQIV